jgi:hypothetical protein
MFGKLKLLSYFFLLFNLFLITPVKAVEIEKKVKVFDFEGKLSSEIILENLAWSKIGDLKVVDLGNDNIPEIIISPSSGYEPYVKIYRLDGSLISQFLSYDKKYLGGVNFTIGDLNSDGKKEIITAATANGGPHIRIFNNQGTIINSFFAFAKNDTGGINVDLGNLYEDLKPEIIVSSNNSQNTSVFDSNGKLLKKLKLENTLKKGQRIVVKDLGNDSVAEILTFATQNGQPDINIYRNDGKLITNLKNVITGLNKGLNLEVDQQKILIGSGIGSSPVVRIIDSYNRLMKEFPVNDKDFISGVKLSVYDNLIYTIPEIYPTATKSDNKYIEIDISSQKLIYYQNGFEIFTYPVSTGKPSTPTRLGNFQVISKYPVAYGGIPGQAWKMPFFIGFYRSGNTQNGIHELPFVNGYREGENHLGIPVSHGCVRLAIGPAEELYNLVDLGTKVYVNN